jgi:hypothetical protein
MPTASGRSGLTSVASATDVSTFDKLVAKGAPDCG